MFQPGPLADFLPEFSVTHPHPLSEQEFATGPRKEPVVLSIAFHTSAHPFTVEPDFQCASRGQCDRWQDWPICFTDAIAAVLIQHQDAFMRPLFAYHGSCAFCALRRTVFTGMTAVSPTEGVAISRGVRPVGVGVSASCSMRVWCSSMPSVTSNFSSSESCTNSSIRNRLAWPSKSWSASDSFGR